MSIGSLAKNAKRRMRVAAIIPAHNEAETVADVVQVALQSQYVDEVIVVDSASGDDTAAVAHAAGAHVVIETTPGKGQAMAAGVAATGPGVLLFLDADLLGLQVGHLDRLIKPVLENKAMMTCGLFDRGPLLNPIFLRFLPILTGERAMRRELFESLDADDIEGYKVEAALNSRCAQAGGRRICFVCPGLWHRTKEKKYENPVEGFVHKVAMLVVAIWEYAAYRIRHRDRRAASKVRSPGTLRTLDP